MSDSTSPSGANDPILAAFFRDFDAASHGGDVLREYCERYPHLASEFDDLAGTRGMLCGSLAERPHDDSIPDRLGDFAILRRIAHGGMGEIYEAIQEPLGRRVAVKTIRGRDRHLTGVLHARFLREQKVLAQLHHTHIVPIHAAGRAGELQYFAMPYIDGAALHHVVRTAWLHESSTPHTPTPSLARLAAEARSRLSQAIEPEQSPARAVPNPHDSGSSSRLSADRPASLDPTMPVGEPPRVGDGPGSAATSSSNGRLALSSEYFRSVARVVIDAAEAVQHAHEAGIIHRDLKPSNLMVDMSEHCWVLDFGLAGYLKANANGEAEGDAQAGATGRRQASGPVPDLGPDPPTVSGVLGTPDYMAPEQFQGRADERTDVWGLGLILYELLTLRRPFRERQAIEGADPIPPRELVSHLSADLEAICAKAMRKPPASRYQTPRELAEDLRRWLRHEPVTARPALALRRALLWCFRNPGWAAALLVSGLAILILGIGGLYLGRQMAEAADARAELFKERGERATAEARHKGEQLVAAQELTRQKQQKLSLQTIQQRRTSPHTNGWFDDIWGQIRQAAEDGNSAVGAQAAASLFGLEAKKLKEFKEFGAYYLAMDSTGEKLLLGGVQDSTKVDLAVKNQLITDAFQRSRDLATAADGPVAFRDDGTPIQLVPQEGRDGGPDTLSLVDLNSGSVLSRFEVPPGRLEVRHVQQLALAAAGKLAAAAVKENGRDSLRVWDAATGRLLRSFAWRCTAIAFSPDDALVAAGDPDGRIRVWSLQGGAVVADLGAGRTVIQCLSFGRDPILRRSTDPRRPTLERGWLLAAGDHGAVVAIYDLRRRQARSICRGSKEQILNVAFSPDGSTLASCGRSTIVWDVATGRLLLYLSGADFGYGLTFTPDGRRLVFCSRTAWVPGSVVVMHLEQGRGIQCYRGLTGVVGQVKFSPNGRRLAALAHDWQVAVWDRDSGRLLAVFDAPQGLFVDNAALAFSPDGRKLAFSGGHEARLWDLDTGDERVWSYSRAGADHEGMEDMLAFPSPDRLISARVETRDGKGFPANQSDPWTHPVVARVRDLLGTEPLRPIRELTDLEVFIQGNALTPDGKFVVLDGLTGPRGKLRHLLNGYDVTEGRRAWTWEIRVNPNAQTIRIDPTGSTVMFRQQEHSGERTLIDVNTARLVRTLPVTGAIGPDGDSGLSQTASGPDSPLGIDFWRRNRGGQQVLFRLELDSLFQPSGGYTEFTRDGRSVAIPSPDGLVLVAEFEEVNRRLTEIGLGW